MFIRLLRMWGIGTSSESTEATTIETFTIATFTLLSEYCIIIPLNVIWLKGTLTV